MNAADSISLWSREQIEKHSVDLRQFIDFRAATLGNGMRIIEAYNSSGLTFSLLPDRGLDIWLAAFNGRPLTWISQNAPHPPDFGLAWLRQFNGGLLVTCGLTHVGPPETDPQTGEQRDIHGRYSLLRAGDLSITRGWVRQANGTEVYAVEMRGTVTESVLFGEQLRLERTYRLVLGSPVIEIHDTVHNVGDTPSPLMLLYHCNVGYPLVAQGTRLHTSSVAVHPRTPWAAEELDRWPEYDAPTPNREEQVYFHQVKAEPDGWAEAALLRADFGLSFQWNTRTAPYLTQWKNTRQGIYVCGVEPGNCIPEGREGARQSGRLAFLDGGATQEFGLRIECLPNSAAVESSRRRIEKLAGEGQIVTGCNYTDYETKGA